MKQYLFTRSQIKKQLDLEMLHLIDGYRKEAYEEEREDIRGELKALMDIRNNLSSKWFVIDITQLLKVGTSVMVIGAVMRFESEGVITSKAFDIGRKMMGV